MYVYLGLCWVLVAARGLSLVVASRATLVVRDRRLQSVGSSTPEQ